MSKKGLQKKKETQQNKLIMAIRGESFSGPLPPPQYLERYNNVFPGLADRITTMAERQSQHRQIMEKRLLWFDGVKSIFGLVFAFVIVVFGLGIGVYLVRL